MHSCHLFVSVPVAGFRVAQAREYWETYPTPPPSTVYGMLLSLVGESDRLAHQGAEIGLAVVSKPEISVVLRTLWRVKKKQIVPGLGENERILISLVGEGCLAGFVGAYVVSWERISRRPETNCLVPKSSSSPTQIVIGEGKRTDALARDLEYRPCDGRRYRRDGFFPDARNPPLRLQKLDVQLRRIVCHTRGSERVVVSLDHATVLDSGFLPQRIAECPGHLSFDLFADGERVDEGEAFLEHTIDPFQPHLAIPAH